MTRRELAEVAQLLRAAARAEIMPRFRKLAAHEIRTKSGPLDLVTDADERAEALLGTGLQRLFPGCTVVGEEAATADPSLLGRLGGAELAFVLDPVDGTANFAAGLPLFGVMAAVIRRGEVVAGVIHDPVGDDTALVLRGEGAWTEAADGGETALRVADPVPVEEMSGSLSWRLFPEPERSLLCRNLPRLGGAWDMRCAAHQYRVLAAGHAHFSLYHRLMPWDHAAGWLLHREAGGWSARLDGSPYSPVEHGGGLLLAPDEASWTALREALFTPRPG